MRKLGSFLSLFLVSSSLLVAQQINVNKDNRTIAVSTDDTATTDADTAVVHIGYQIYGVDEQSTYANASKISNAVAKALATAGVKPESIESQSQTIQRVQPFELQNLPADQKAQRQFTAQQTWTVKTSAKDASSVLDTAVKAGANSSGEIEWTVADQDALEAQAAGKALKRAREIAERMAQGLGAKLGVLVYASNQVSSPVRPMMMEMAMAKAPSPRNVEPLALNPKKVTRSATVYAVFSIE